MPAPARSHALPPRSRRRYAVRGSPRAPPRRRRDEYRTRIRAATPGLEPVDGLDGRGLRNPPRSGDRREDDFECAPGCFTVGESTLHGRGQVLDAATLTHLHELAYRSRVRGRDRRDLVEAGTNRHRVLGDLFGVTEKLGAGGRITLRRDSESLVPASGSVTTVRSSCTATTSSGAESGGREITERQQIRTRRGCCPRDPARRWRGCRPGTGCRRRGRG